MNRVVKKYTGCGRRAGCVITPFYRLRLAELFQCPVGPVPTELTPVTREKEELKTVKRLLYISYHSYFWLKQETRIMIVEEYGLLWTGAPFSMGYLLHLVWSNLRLELAFGFHRVHLYDTTLDSTRLDYIIKWILLRQKLQMYFFILVTVLLIFWFFLS